MNINNFRDELKFILNDTIDWLKFAEAKHVGLITFNLALLALNFSLLDSSLFKNFSFLIFILILSNFISISISILSFLPQIMDLKPIQKLLKKYIFNTSNNTNLLFYKVIAQYDANTYATKLIEKYSNNQINNISSFDLDLSNQITSISKLCCAKYYLFSINIKILIIPFIISIAMLIIA